MSGTIDFSAPITAGGGASFALLNEVTATFPSDANHTAAQAELAAAKIYVISSVPLTQQRDLVVNLVKGLLFHFTNNTTGGQSIRIVGPSGTGVAIPNGSDAWVTCDGTNFFCVAQAPDAPWGADVFGFGGVGEPKAVTQVALGVGGKAIVYSAAGKGADLTDATTQVTELTIPVATLPNDTNAVLSVEVSGADYTGGTLQTDQADVVFAKILINVSHTGTITFTCGTATGAGPVSVATASVTSNLSGVGGATSPFAGARITTSGGNILFQMQGAASKVYKLTVVAQLTLRLL